MSVWKKAAKSHQKVHRERHQPQERSHLGLLEKKKDYVKRAKDYNEKKDTLKVLRKRVLNKNPDEFYHHMINSKLEDGHHFDKETEDEDTPDQIQLMRTQDLKYVATKRTQELKKIEKLQSQLHLTNIDHNVKNTHIHFTNEGRESVQHEQLFKILSEKELPEVDVNQITKNAKTIKNIYSELGKRIDREKQLSVIQQKIEIQRHLANKRSVLPPKRLKGGTKDSPPVYAWKYERKK